MGHDAVGDVDEAANKDPTAIPYAIGIGVGDVIRDGDIVQIGGVSRFLQIPPPLPLAELPLMVALVRVWVL